MARPSRGIRYALAAAAVFAAVIVVGLAVLTRTDFGAEQAGRVVLDRLRGSINGELEVGRIRSGGLLRGVTLHDVRIDDPDGRPFLRADSARLAYRVRTLLTGAIAFDRLIVHGLEVHIERLPGREEWNYQIVFPGDTVQPDTVDDPGLVLIEDITLVDGLAVVRIPWEPDGPVAPEDTARLILEEAPGGLVRTLRFTDIDARLPRVLWENRDEEGRLVRVGELGMTAYVWDAPAHVRRLEGTLTLRDSLVAFDAPRVRLPDSEAAVSGTIITGEPNLYDIQIEGDDLAFADFQWLYPRLPEAGGGAARFRIRSLEGGEVLWLAEEARLRAGTSEVAGSFGVVTGDSVYFANVDLRAAPLDVDLLRTLLPVDLPLDGLLIGTVEVEGPISSLRTRGELRYQPRGGGAPSSARWAGTVGARPPYAARDLTVEVRGFRLAHLRSRLPGLVLDGTASGEVRAAGSLYDGLRLDGGVEIERDGFPSSIRGGGTMAVNGRGSRFDLGFDARPVALELLGDQVPALARLTGAAEGPITVTGTLEDLRIDVDLRTPAGGLALAGRLGLTDSGARFSALGGITGFRFDRILDGLPETDVTGRFSLEAAGGDLGSLRGAARVDVDSARVAGVSVHGGTLHGSVADGLLDLDSLRLATAVGDLRGAGTFGLTPDRSGTLNLSLRADSLSRLEPVVFPGLEDDELLVEAGPRLTGMAVAEGVLRGNLHAWTARGTAEGVDLVYDDVRARRARASIEASPEAVTVEAALDSVELEDRRLRHAAATVRYADRAGTVVLRAVGPASEELEAGGAFARIDGGATLRIDDFSLSTAAGRWRLEEAVAARVARHGVAIEELALVRAPDRARIRAAGTLPWAEGAADLGGVAADMVLELDRVPLGELLAAGQFGSTIDGHLTGRVRVSGSALAPVADGRLEARPFRYGGAALDSAAAELAYRDRLLTGRFEGWRADESLLRGDGHVPLDLSLADRERRVLDRSMRVRVQVDSVPAALVSFLAPGFVDLTGTVDADLTLVGTGAKPELHGRVALMGGAGLFEPLNVRYRGIDAVATMAGDTRVALEAHLRTRRGTADVRGSLDVREPGDPAFDLTVAARRFEAANRRDVAGVTDGELRLTGSYTRPVVRGALRLAEGELNIDEVWRQHQVVQLDPTLFDVFGTGPDEYRPPGENPFLANVRLDGVTVGAERDVWVRSRELNVEVVGSLEVRFDRRAGDLRMIGPLQVRRGAYDLQFAQAPGVPARRFDIRDGTIEFVGTPGIDPNLDIRAGYRVRRAHGEPIDVVANLTGTLQNPRVRLSSDSDLPLSQSDLASYILFGRTGAELSQAESDILSSGLSLVRPALTGFASTELQRVFASLGLAVDYVAVRTPEYGWGEYGAFLRDRGIGGVFSDAQLEVGVDLTRDVFVVGSYRLATGGGAAGADGPLNQLGFRLEYRFLPTWTGEFYLEDRFARTPSFGLAEIDDRKVMGWSIFREWGY